MANIGLVHFLSIVLFLDLGLLCNAVDKDRTLHIVYMGSLPEGNVYEPSSNHLSMLQEIVEDSSTENILVRSYGRSFNGFAAHLTDHEIQKLIGKNGVVSVFPSRTLQLHTTRSWDFSGLTETVKRKPQAESNVIVGVIDSGIWPGLESFSDEGFGPIPKKWKGACKGGKKFTCNNKLIGARYYTSDKAREHSAWDGRGHGTHTASIAAGNKVKDASFYGLAKGVARGGAHSARIAAYKVCDLRGCNDVDVLAAFDDAIADGVDIISISLGGTSAEDFVKDVMAIGAFHAMEKGILTVTSAGNEGPDRMTVVNVSPWSISVAASTSDRMFIDKVVLQNGTTLVGQSINRFSLNGTKYPLVLKKDDSVSCCKDKIVVIDQLKEEEVRADGGIGIVFEDSEQENISSVVSMPAIGLRSEIFEELISYVKSTKEPLAEILKSETINNDVAPVVIGFSSRGPNAIAHDVMKPDITAPGVNILAAYPPSVEAPGSKYYIMSGTSMSCPHVSGVAAYVKSFHPDWSPSAIRSAIMTTALPMKPSQDAEFEYGSGHINPTKAINPGLVYEAFKEDYIEMLCNMGYDVKKLRRLSGDNSTCPKGSGKGSPRDLNYPSMTASVSKGKNISISFHRTVTNVGVGNSTYKAKIFTDSRVSIKVVPEVLSFKSLNEKKSFDVIVFGGQLSLGNIVSSSLEWSDGRHNVRSPIVVYASNFKSS